ncbi:putative sulfate/molybdate transporter [Candidatus Bathyarchaeota archaeon]|nr:putative sulfate/molybdate transporter [Candidatus Bathyarchaeota archaeon]
MDEGGDRGGLRFNLRELGGALGDFLPLHPLFLSSVRVLGLNPASSMLVMGASNILLGAYYRIPLPIEPMKALTIYAIANRWDAGLIFATAFGTAILWLSLSISGLLDRMLRFVPDDVVKGIQLALAVYFLSKSIELMGASPGIALLSIAVIVMAMTPTRWRIPIPPTLLLFPIGIMMASFSLMEEGPIAMGFYIPRVHLFSIGDVWRGMLEVGFAQAFLTLSNAILATRNAVNERFTRKIRDGQLALNMGLMNLGAAFLGCVPLCHGSGGFMTQYLYGARTGGAMVMEGVIELVFALSLSTVVTHIFSRFPLAIIGAMLLPASIELGRGALRLRGWRMLTAILVAAASYLTNFGVGFLIGLAVHLTALKLRLIEPESKGLKEEG